jgi:KEOPS complex subunit Pcc1
MIAEFEIDLSDPEIVYRSLLPELKDKRSRAEIKLKIDASSKLGISIRAEDVVIFRAVLNTWLRLIKIADEMVELKMMHPCPSGNGLHNDAKNDY